LRSVSNRAVHVVEFHDAAAVAFDDNNQKIDTAKQFLKEIRIWKDKTDFLNSEQLNQIRVKVGVAESDLDKLIWILEESGHAIRVSSLRRTDKLLYLKPLRLVEEVNIFVDSDEKFKVYREACAIKAEEELREMEEKKQAVETNALWHTRAKMFGGAAIITSYVGMTGYLTAVVFSWDVMEPLTYFFGGAVNVLAVAYAGYKNQDFDWKPQFDKWRKSGLSTISKRKKFDLGRYEGLKEYVRRLR